MNYAEKRPSFISHPIVKAIIGWTIFVSFYCALKNSSGKEIYSGLFSLIGESGLDAIAAILTFKLWLKFKRIEHGKIFLYLSISFIASFIADSIYNIFINIFRFKYENTFIDVLFDFPFAIFLSLQLIVWSYIIYSNKNIKTNRKNLFYTPTIALSLLLFIMFMFGIPWKIDHFSVIGLFQSLDTILEVSGFALAAICLARSKCRIVRFIATGYLIIVSSDFIIRYYVVSGIITYLSPFESTWVLGLLIICLGCYLYLNENTNEIFRLLPVNSLQSQITIWSLILWLGSVLLFILTHYFFSEHYEYCQITPGFLSILVPASVLSIIGSSYLSTKISSPLSKLEDIINKFIKTDNINIIELQKQVEVIREKRFHQGKEYNNFEIYEIENLNIFIMNTLNELQLANRVKTEFLMNMSHDFRTPASGIYHMSKTIYKKMNDPELMRLQKLVVESSEQLMNLLEDVLDYSRLSNNKYNPNFKNISIESIIHDVITFVSAKAQEKKLRITYQNLGLPPNFQGDRLMIHKIILNIVSNAIKFTHVGGVTITTSEKNIDNLPWLLITIEDTGIGIDKDNHKMIFEPFIRIESAETGQYPGIGLGLSNVFLMLKEISGKIFLESSLNTGSTFNIFLPIH